METWARVSRNVEVISGEPTRLYNSYWGMGYTGTTLVVMYNRCGDVIGVTQPESHGVEAKAWFWNANDRRIYWSQQFEPELTRRTRSIQIIHGRGSKGDFVDRYNYYRDIGCRFWDALGGPGSCRLPRL